MPEPTQLCSPPPTEHDQAAADFLARLDKAVTQRFQRPDWFSHAFCVWSGQSPTEFRDARRALR